ncbi:hypothetical protein J6590_088415 [Homalodisca vitripennis]|nr:hypothetical protein J6590_088415 [Homalodisca vitripennis]
MSLSSVLNLTLSQTRLCLEDMLSTATSGVNWDNVIRPPFTSDFLQATMRWSASTFNFSLKWYSTRPFNPNANDMLSTATSGVNWDNVIRPPFTSDFLQATMRWSASTFNFSLQDMLSTATSGVNWDNIIRPPFTSDFLQATMRWSASTFNFSLKDMLSTATSGVNWDNVIRPSFTSDFPQATMRWSASTYNYSLQCYSTRPFNPNANVACRTRDMLSTATSGVNWDNVIRPSFTSDFPQATMRWSASTYNFSLQCYSTRPFNPNANVASMVSHKGLAQHRDIWC